MTATPIVSATKGEEVRIPSLDGLRAVSIVLVLVWHLEMTRTVPGLWRVGVVQPGNLGVRIFFVISGFLITTLLLSEHARRGRISLGRFYLRRALRIMPAYYTFLAAIALATAAGLGTVSWSSLLSAATYTANYHHLSLEAHAIGHSWSLAVEEQFYLLWPGTLVLLGLNRGFKAAWVMLLIAPACRVAAHRLGPLWPDNPIYSFECVADALATGCLLARYRDRLWTWVAYRRLMGRAGAALWPAAVIALAAANVQWPAYAAALGITLLNLAIAAGIDWCLRNPDTALGRLLNARPVAFIGTLSYSLYLWHVPFMPLSGAPGLPVMFALIAVATLGSYYLVERPGLALRKRIEARRASREGETSDARPPSALPVRRAASDGPPQFVGRTRSQAGRR